MDNRPSRVADEVWIATALLHREQPDREDFSIAEIIERAEREGLVKPLRPGVRVHATLHCVAGLPPNPGRYSMLTATGPGRRRLFQTGDPVHPERIGAKVTPDADQIPEAYRPLLDWYRDYAVSGPGVGAAGALPDPLLELRGSGAETWADESPDEYVERLRSGW